MAGATPTPVVKVDNIRDPFATLVSVDIGEKADLLDTVRHVTGMTMTAPTGQAQPVPPTVVLSRVARARRGSVRVQGLGGGHVLA